MRSTAAPYAPTSGWARITVAMSAVGARAGHELRSRRAWLGLALVAALGAAAVMTAAVGARRTDRAYGRFDRAQLGADLVVLPSFGTGLFAPPFEKVRKLPQVAVAGQLFLVPGAPLNLVYAPPPVHTRIDRFKMLEGRPPRAVDEVALGFAFAESHHLEVGSHIPMQLASAVPDIEGQRAPAVQRTLRVVGIEASPGEFPPQLDSTFPSDFAHVGRATWTSLQDKVYALDETVVRLRRGQADIASFTAELHRLVGGQPQLNLIRSQQAANVQRSIHLQAVALWLLGGLLGLVTLGVLSQLLARQAVVEAADNDTLRALGMVRSQLFTLGMIRAGAIGLVAAVIGGVIAVLASPLTPIGTARTAELHPGMTADVLVLGVGAVATMALILALSAWPVWRASAVDRGARSAPATTRPSALARASAALGLPPTANAGVRMAVEPGRGRGAVPVRSSLLAVVVAVTALVGTITFGAGLNRLLATPRLYGWNWDAHVVANRDGISADDIVRLLKDDDRVQDVAEVDTPPLAIGTTEFDGMFLRQAKGVIEPVLLEGRAPRGPDEVALGSETLRQVHAGVGSMVSIRITAIGADSARFRVVGRVVMRPQSSNARLGRGAVLDYSAEKRLVPPGVDVPPITDAELRLAPDVDHQHALAAIRARLGDAYEMSTPERPADLVNFGRVQNLPLILGAIVGLLGAVTLAQTLMTSIRRRRRDLSILKTLGFTQGQVRVAVAWQATVSVVLAVVIGLPLGVAAGRVAWTAFATRLGAAPDAVTPLLLLAITLPAAVVLANLIAAAPAAIAGRMRPAQVLRTE
jgi:hypothetical protein